MEHFSSAFKGIPRLTECRLKFLPSHHTINAKSNSSKAHFQLILSRWASPVSPSGMLCLLPSCFYCRFTMFQVPLEDKCHSEDAEMMQRKIIYRTLNVAKLESPLVFSAKIARIAGISFMFGHVQASKSVSMFSSGF